MQFQIIQIITCKKYEILRLQLCACLFTLILIHSKNINFELLQQEAATQCHILEADLKRNKYLASLR